MDRGRCLRRKFMLFAGKIVNLLGNNGQFDIDRFGVVIQRWCLAQNDEGAQYAGGHEQPQKQSVHYHSDESPVLVLLWFNKKMQKHKREL